MATLRATTTTLQMRWQCHSKMAHCSRQHRLRPCRLEGPHVHAPRPSRRPSIYLPCIAPLPIAPRARLHRAMQVLSRRWRCCVHRLRWLRHHQLQLRCVITARACVHPHPPCFARMHVAVTPLLQVVLYGATTERAAFTWTTRAPCLRRGFRRSATATAAPAISASL